MLCVKYVQKILKELQEDAHTVMVHFLGPIHMGRVRINGNLHPIIILGLTTIKAVTGSQIKVLPTMHNIDLLININLSQIIKASHQRILNQITQYITLYLLANNQRIQSNSLC